MNITGTTSPHFIDKVFSTLDNAYSQIITSMTLSAQDHVSLSEAITSQVIDALKSVEKKSEEAKRKVGIFPAALLRSVCRHLTACSLIANPILSEIAF